MTAEQAEQLTGLTARIVPRIESPFYVSKTDAQKWNDVGDQWRFQIDRELHSTGIVEQRDGDKVIKMRWYGPVFHVLGFGRNFEEAAAMAIKNQNK